MAFSYLQTDDRDDYFNQFSKKPSNKDSGPPICSYTLIDKDGKIILNYVPSFRLKAYSKKHYIPFGTSAKYIWKKILLSKGYIIKSNYYLTDPNISSNSNSSDHDS